MKKRLRLLAWMLTLTMLCELLPFSAFAQSDVGQQLTLAAAQSLEEENGEATIIGKCGDNLQWSLSSDGVLTIDGTGEMDDYDSDDSPAPWYGYSYKIKIVIINHGITHIGNSAFDWCSSITSISIPSSVISIGSHVFRGCSTLTTINIPDSVTSIGDYTFLYCKSLTTANIPSSMTSISKGTFAGCSSLSSINIPKSVISIGPDVFASCTSLTTINIPDSVTSIDDGAFGGCTSLTFISIPESVTHLGDGALSGCTSLTSINIPDSITSINPYAFRNCTSLTSIIIPASVVSIGSGAFEGCTSLTAVNIPDSVVSIGKEFDTLGVFENCSSLASVSIPNSVTSIGYRIFSNCTSLVSIAIPQSISEISGNAFEGCTSLTSIDIPESITGIAGEAFSGCTSLSSISIPNSVTEIGPNAFEGCSFLTSIILPESISEIECGTFKDCTSLTSINIPEFVTYISDSFTDEGAFENCTSLISISIPKSVTEIGRNAFKNCTALYDVYYSGNQEQWGSISIDSGNDPLLNATIHYQSTGPEDEKKFTFGRDNFSFEHNSKDFFGDSNNSAFLISQFNKLSNTPLSTQHYLISSDELKQLTRGLSASDAQAIENETYEPWEGSCYGLTFVSMLHYTHPERLPLGGFDFVDSSNQTIYNLEKPAYSVRNTSLINYYYLTQFHPIVNNLMETRARKCKNHPQKAISEIIDGLNNNSSVFVSLGTHVIILLSILSERDDHYLIRVYDPNTNSDGTTGQNPSKLILYKSTSPNSKSEFPTIKYSGGGHNYNYIEYYFLDNEISEYDFPNYFGYDFAAGETPHYTYPILKLRSDGAFTFSSGSSYFKFFNGEISDCSNNYKDLLIRRTPKDTVNSSADTFTISLPSSEISDSITLQAFSSQESGVDLLLNDTLLSISTNGPVSLTYNEEARTVDVTAENPTDVNLLFTQNDTSEAWPWHSWAIDTTGTTKFHAELDDDGLHLSGDGIANAKVGTENMDSEKTDTIALPAKAEGSDALEVTITNKKDSTDNDRLTINGSEPSEPTDPKPADPNPDKPSSPSTPAAPSGGSGDGNGSGAGALLLVGAGAAAAAITAGVIMMSPVDVKGRVVLADQAAVPGAKISLLREGKVVAQTTADENGSFSLKAKRGSYQLTAAYTDANGQIIHQTIDIKAPAKDLVVTF